jgi:hypothetical protein
LEEKKCEKIDATEQIPGALLWWQRIRVDDQWCG